MNVPPALCIVDRRDRAELMPVFSPGKIPPQATSAPPGYIVAEAPSLLVVHLDGVPPGPYELPVTQQKRRTAARVAGTPLAIAADAAMVGACAAGLAVQGLGSAGGN